MTFKPCKRHQLDHGLETLLIPTHHAPVVAIQAWIRFGAADESDEIAGLAHLFEHILFKGTEKRGVGEIAKEVEGLGGDLNAFTTYDHTVMHMTLGKDHLSQGLDILSDALINSIVDPTELEREKLVVLEEIKRRNDRPSSKSADEIRQMLFGKHPYSRPVIGYDKIVAGMSRDEIFNNYKKFYNSKNIFITLAGDIEEQKSIDLISQKFAKLPTGELPGLRAQDESPIKHKVSFQKAESSNIIGHICWKGVSAKHEDCAALDVLSFIFGQSESSRLIKRLVHQDKLLRDVGAWSWAPKESGSLEIDIRATPNNGPNIGKVFDAIREEIEKPITLEELNRAKKNILAQATTSKESVDGLAQRFAYFESVTGNWEDDLRFHDKVKSLSISEIERAREDYFKWDECVIAGIYPSDQKKPVTKVTKKKNRPAKSTESKVEEGKVYSFSLDGLKVLVKPQFHLPIFSMRWTGLGGIRMESNEKAGISNLWARCVDTGCVSRDGKNMNRETINKIFDDMSAELHAFSGRNSFGFYVDGMSEDFDRLVEIFSEIYKNPSFDPKEVAAEKKQQINQIKSMIDSPTAVMSKLFHEKMFGKHSFSRSAKGTAQTVRALTAKDLKLHHNRLWKQPQVVCVVGNVTPARVKAALMNCFDKAHFPKNSPLQKQKRISYPSRSVEARKKLKKEQSHIMIGFPTDGLRSMDRHALNGLSAVLSGQGGRLFLELRDRMSLCYSVGPTQLDGIDGGYFGFYIGTSPDKEDTAIKAIEQEIERLCMELIPEDEWARARRFYVGNHLIEQQHFSSQAFGMALDELYGLGYNDYFKLEDHLNRLNPQRLQRVARKIFSRPRVQVSVGPK